MTCFYKYASRSPEKKFVRICSHSHFKLERKWERCTAKIEVWFVSTSRSKCNVFKALVSIIMPTFALFRQDWQIYPISPLPFWSRHIYICILRINTVWYHIENIFKPPAVCYCGHFSRKQLVVMISVPPGLMVVYGTFVGEAKKHIMNMSLRIVRKS